LGVDELFASLLLLDSYFSLIDEEMFSRKNDKGETQIS
jgi:hypothetical protein